MSYLPALLRYFVGALNSGGASPEPPIRFLWGTGRIVWGAGRITWG